MSEFKQQKWSMEMIPKDMLIKKNKRLEQTLAEIKEIAEKNLNIHSCAFTGCGYDLITNQILRKISEVIDG